MELVVFTKAVESGRNMNYVSEEISEAIAAILVAAFIVLFAFYNKDSFIYLCNTLVPEVAEYFGARNSKPESWISAIYNDIKKEHWYYSNISVSNEGRRE